MLTTRPVAALALLAAAGLLGACQGHGYTVRVHNQTQEAVYASIHQAGEPLPLARQRVGPNDSEWMGARPEGSREVFLRVDATGNEAGYPAEVPLDRGHTVVNVRPAEPGAASAIRVEPVPRP